VEQIFVGIFVAPTLCDGNVILKTIFPVVFTQRKNARFSDRTGCVNGPGKMRCVTRGLSLTVRAAPRLASHPGGAQMGGLADEDQHGGKVHPLPYAKHSQACSGREKRI